MPRRCVICGLEDPHDEFGNRQYYYPKNKQEAKIWKESLQAENVSINALQNYSCVCYKHIPDFVDQTSRIASGLTFDDGLPSHPSQTPRCKKKSPINVLLMTGASLPTYCGKSCTEEPPGPYDKQSESDICVLESSFSDMGITLPDDHPEISVMHCNPKIKEKENKGQSDYDDISDFDFYLDGEEEEDKCDCATCTDVLVMARAKDLICPCGRTTSDIPDDSVCCPTGCSPQPAPRAESPPCGCECEQAVREELESVIQKQELRIRELEFLLHRQSEIHDQIFSKVEDLHKDILKKPAVTDVFEPINPSPGYTEERIKIEEELKKKKKEEKKVGKLQSLLFDTLAKPSSEKNPKKQQPNKQPTDDGKDINGNDNKMVAKGYQSGNEKRASKSSIVVNGNRRESLGKVSIKEDPYDPEDPKDDKPEPKASKPEKREKIPFCRKFKYMLKKRPG